ncbi:MAG: hypothetical protein QOH01_1705 [Verrucomicrobiota bacterium]|jgi:hypothetical protein
MNGRLIFLCIVLVLSALRLAPGESSSNLQSADRFALGGVGVAGTMSAGERALRELLKQPDAVAQLEALISRASPAGKLYALLGLRIRDRAAYGRALEKCRTTDAKVETARGCILGQESFRDLLKEIERGQYDTFLAREWPERTR